MNVKTQHKKYFIISFVALWSMPIMAKSKAIATNSWVDLIFENILLISGTIILAFGMITICRVIFLLLDLKLHGFDHPDFKYTQAKESLLSKATNYLIGLKPMSSETDIELDHDYDGIKELDNSLPPWWLYSFFLTIIIGIAYLYVYEFSDIGLTQEEEYYAEMKVASQEKRAFLAAQANAVDETNVVLLTDNKSIHDGMLVYKGNCAVCHGQLGQGGVGPNLTDDYWLHGNTTASVFKTIKYGVPERGMVSWKERLSPVSIQKLTSYIATLYGTDPPDAKAPQGELYDIVAIDTSMTQLPQ